MVLVAAAVLLGQSAPDLTLGQWVSRRFQLARGVALAKLATRAPIEDRVREGQVLERVRRSVLASRASTAQTERSVRFFRVQIEASKAAQAAWQREWRRVGAPMEPIPTLAQLRVKIDALEAAFVSGRVRPTWGGATLPREKFLRPAWAIAISRVP